MNNKKIKERMLSQDGVFATSWFAENVDHMAVCDEAIVEMTDSFDVVDGVAIIPVHDFLAHRFDYHMPGIATGYGFVKNSIAAANENSSVTHIVLDVNSHGGEVSGAFEAGRAIYNSEKPVTAIVDENAHSAGYLLACCADEIVLASETASVGSIGVVTMHVDQSKMLESYGLKVTMIYAGDRKVDGNPYEPLSEPALQNISARIKRSYELFVGHVASNRSMSEEAVRATEAATFSGSEAIAAGLADRIETRSGAIASIINPQKETLMSVETPIVPKADVVVVDQKARIQAIVTSEAAASNQTLAQHIAFNTDIEPDVAISIIQASGVPVVAVLDSNAFNDAMENGNPNIAAGFGGDDEDVPDVAQNPFLALFAKQK